ncbi:hypothetical protein [Paraburkholderia sp. MM5477-R1]|uniref:hypothetical protein n=1 Tax=Paraburkholderia sp. MM5477-R1 TaxID=2991062 RepID=UPI003D1924C3
MRGYRHECFGHWCAYVGVPPSHPLFGHDFRDAVPYPPGALERPFAIDEHGVLNTFAAMFDRPEWRDDHALVCLIIGVHGGLSYSGHLRGDSEHWYFGFDCGHAGDLKPGGLCGGSTYRTMESVKGECRQLAGQLAGYGREATDEDARRKPKTRE